MYKRQALYNQKKKKKQQHQMDQGMTLKHNLMVTQYRKMQRSGNHMTSSIQTDLPGSCCWHSAQHTDCDWAWWGQKVFGWASLPLCCLWLSLLLRLRKPAWKIFSFLLGTHTSFLRIYLWMCVWGGVSLCEMKSFRNTICLLGWIQHFSIPSFFLSAWWCSHHYNSYKQPVSANAH